MMPLHPENDIKSRVIELSGPALDWSPEREWRSIGDQASDECRTLVAATAEKHAEALADSFYAGMMVYPSAAVFLDHTTVHQRLHGSMMRWLKALFVDPMLAESDVQALVAQQRHVGEVHARIQLPIHLVARGARMLKRDMFRALDESTDDLGLCRQALTYVSQLMDLAFELMSAGHLRNTERVVRTDEAYRLFSLGQNISVERERQRSALMEWAQDVLFALHRNPKMALLPRLSTSEFGLWFTHKAAAMFEGAQELDQISEIMVSLDTTLLPMLCLHSEADAADLLQRLESDLHSLKFLLSTLFERNLEVENSRDTLTRLLNRRFLPAVINREIRVAHKRGTGFALLMIDVDHFKLVNDKYGHDAGDVVLQQVAAVILNVVRNGDFVFRYGGEEILVMLVEASAESALRVADVIRGKFESTAFLLSEGRTLKTTVSVGVAVYDGHPDYQYLISRADQAMYKAKQAGRNQVKLA